MSNSGKNREDFSDFSSFTELTEFSDFSEEDTQPEASPINLKVRKYYFLFIFCDCITYV